MNYIEYNPNQKELFGYRPEDVLAEDHLAYLIDELVENFDLTAFYDFTPGAGSPAYNPKLMLKILFLGYAVGIFSSRKLQQQCQENLAFIHLTRGQRPKFRAICEFRVRHKENIKELFPQMIQIVQKLKVVRLGRLILDSTKIRANASAKRFIRAEKYQEVIDSIDNYLQKAHSQDIEEDSIYGKELSTHQLPKFLHSKPQRLKRLRALIQQAKEQELKYINTTDPDAKFIKDTSCGKIKPSYNIQTALDAETGLIVAYKTTNTATDNEHLEDMVKQAEEITSTKPEKVDADSGYYSNSSVGRLEKEQIDTCIPDANTASALHRGEVPPDEPNSWEYTQDKFEYSAEENSYTCPRSKKLFYQGQQNIGNKTVKRYICAEDCSCCVDAKRCLRYPGARHRVLTINSDHQVLLSIQKKFQKAEYRHRYRERAAFIERIFGHFKKNIKFLQFHLRGKSKVDVEAALLCIGFNLLVIRHWW